MNAVQQVTALVEAIKDIAFFGQGGAPMPVDSDLDPQIAAGALLLPMAYQAAFVTPARAAMPRLLALARENRIHMSSVEIVAGAVYQHAPGWMLGAEVRRFAAVISNLYRSFLDRERRIGAKMPVLTETLPPLAAFASDGSAGPTTLPVDLTRAYLQAGVGVVALPATMAAHPILWMTLVHETGGHDVTHADPGLLDELSAALPTVLAPLSGQTTLSDAELHALWARWMDEAAADIYALLNAGPAFAENLAAMLAAMAGGAAPALRMASRADDDGQIDPHPTDILRLHLLIGGIGALTAFPPAAEAIQRLRDIAAAFGTGSTIALEGTLPDGKGGNLTLAAKADRDGLARAAEAVGRHIAATPLRALGGQSIQAIETWDADDIHAVAAIRDALTHERPIAGLGDDAQLLAAATEAVLEDADSYGRVTEALAAALDESFRKDPVWSLPVPDRMYLRHGRTT